MRSLLFQVFLVLVLLVSRPVRAELPEIRIGFINELTGPVASLGAVCASGIEIAMNTYAPGGQVQGIPVRLVIGDARDDVGATLSEFRRMVDLERVHAVASIRSKSAIPINPLAEKSKIPVLGVVGSPEFLKTNKYAVRIFASPERQARFEADLAKRQGKRRAAIVMLEDEFTAALGRNLGAELRSSGVDVVYNETVLPQETDFSTVISRVKRNGADAVYAHLLTRTGLFVRKFRELGAEGQIYAWYWIQQPEQMQAAGESALEGLIFSEIDSDKPRFKEAYHASYPGKEYNAAAYLCYVTMAAALQAAAAPDARASADTLREAITNIREVSLLDGPVAFKDREIQFELAARRFVRGKAEPLD